MSRRSGQNPSVRIGKRADGSKYYYFQYYVDSPMSEERQRKTEVLGVVGQMTASEASRKRVDFLQKLGVNSSSYRIPDSRTFADAVYFYRNEFSLHELRDSTRDVAESHIRTHLEPYWKDVPVEHIDIDRINAWARTKRPMLSWTTIRNVLRTMQRVLSCASKDKRPPFSLKGLRVPAQDQLQMKINSRKAISFSWTDATRIADTIRTLDGLDAGRKSRYATVCLLASATGLRCGELFALRMNDLDFRARTVRVDESVDRLYQIGPCKNASAYRTVLLVDREGKKALRVLKSFVGTRIQNPSELVFHSKRGSPIRETNLLHEALHPALGVLGLPKAGMHAFRRGCNRRWELAGLEPPVLRQIMGHSSAAMTAHYTGEVPLAQIKAAFSRLNGPKIVVSENKENEAAA